MTASERLAKVAEVLAGHVDQGGGWRCSCQPEREDGGRDVLPVLWEKHLAAALAPLLDEFQAEDEARGAARVREAVEALADEWHQQASEARRHGTPNARMSKRHAARSLKRALDAAEKAAGKPANAPLAAEPGESGSQGVRDAAGLSEAHRGSEEAPEPDRSGPCTDENGNPSAWPPPTFRVVDRG